MPTPLTTLDELDDADSEDREKLLDGTETRTSCCFQVVPTDCLLAACSHGRHEFRDPYTGETYRRDDMPCDSYAPEPALTFHLDCPDRRSYSQALSIARQHDTLEYLDDWPEDPEPCPSECQERQPSGRAGTWQCPECGQLWTAPDRGLRTWSPEDQAQHQELWAKALLSDHYRQGSRCLRQPDPKGGPDFYCCLGVATDMCPFTSWTRLPDGTYQAVVGDNESTSIDLLHTVSNWLGVKTPFASFDDLPQHRDYLAASTHNYNFIHLNDSLNLDFRTLAEIIRAKPPGLFA